MSAPIETNSYRIPVDFLTKEYFDGDLDSKFGWRGTTNGRTKGSVGQLWERIAEGIRR